MDLDLLLRLLRDYCAKEHVEALLKNHNLPFSAKNWDVLLGERLIPNIEAGNISVEEVLDLVREGEEFGQQHVYLYGAETGNFAQQLRGGPFAAFCANVEAAFGSIPRLVDRPEEIEIVDVRDRDEDGGIVVKCVETHTYEERLDGANGAVETDGDRVVREFRLVRERSVTTFRMRPDDVLEVRLQSHRRGRRTSEYPLARKRAWVLVSPLLPQDQFSPIHISPFTQWLWDQRDNLEGQIRIPASDLLNDAGIRLRARGMIEQDLPSNGPTESAIAAFLQGNAYFEGFNFFWLTSEDGTPPDMDVHVLVQPTGERNEFVLTQQRVMKSNYEFAVSSILAHC